MPIVSHKNPYAACVQLGIEKVAGRVDNRALMRFVKGLRYGDIINFNESIGDAFESSIREGIDHSYLSATIKKVTGSPEHHTGMYAGIHPQTGEPMVMHNAGGLQYSPLRDYAHTSRFTAYRVPGVSDKDAAKALGKTFAAWRSGKTIYPKTHLTAAAGPVIAQRLAKKYPRAGGILGGLINSATRLIAKPCGPFSSICSTVPVEAYGQIIGRPQANRLFTGQDLPEYRQDWSTTSGMMRDNLQRVARYSPRDSAGTGFGGVVRGIARRLRKR